MKNTLYFGDNLDVLRRYVADNSVDLVYLDPPFNSDQNYNVLFAEQDGTRSAAQIHAFEDTWKWDESAARAYQEVVEGGDKVADALIAFHTVLGGSDMLAYLSMMAPRLKELHRVLKPTGSIYLHCDPTASHYLKMLLDAVFGPDMFLGEVVWKRTNARSTLQRWPRVHDVLLFYSKTDGFLFHSLKTKADAAKLPHTLITVDGVKYQTYELTAPGATKEGDSGKPWKGFDPSAMGRHWADNQTKMDEWDSQGLIHWPKPGTAGGFPRRRASEPFDASAREITIGDVWTDIDRINQAAKERLGYPTQKPEALLERIINASSSEGDIVLDPFCGCGTAISAAQKLKRSWIGIDITALATSLIKNRLHTAFGESIKESYQVIGEPVSLSDAQALAEQDKYQFQWWALGLVNARPVEQKKGADKGIDGRILFHDEHTGTTTKQIIISVKGGHLQAGYVRDLRGVIEREKAAIGVLITMEPPTGPMRKEAASAGFYKSPWNDQDYPRLQILTVAELLEGKGIDAPIVRDKRVQTIKRAPKVKGKDTHKQQDMF
jgi:site-specific DNA-methyltransferase (adenine-specific)